MEITVFSVLLVGALCAMTAFCSHLGIAVFNDGVRPFVPEMLEGRMPRPEYAVAVFGLCVGFIASVGIGNALATNLLNPWLLFLATDIIGAACPNKISAAIAGAAWGILCLLGLGGINTVLTCLPVDILGSLGQLGTYVVTGFALFPVVAIIMQFGWQRGVITAVLALIARVVGPMWKFGPTQASISADAWCLLVGVVALKPEDLFFDAKGAVGLDDTGSHIVSAGVDDHVALAVFLAGVVTDIKDLSVLYHQILFLFVDSGHVDQITVFDNQHCVHLPFFHMRSFRR